VTQDFAAFPNHSQERLSGPESLLPGAAYSFEGYTFLGQRHWIRVSRPPAANFLFKD
jgi:hypothetical protein